MTTDDKDGSATTRIKADFNHLDGAGNLVLSDLRLHVDTPFEEIATSGNRILFVQGEDVVPGFLSRRDDGIWVGDPNWDAQSIEDAH